MAYEKTNWVDNITPVNADNMNKIENELELLSNQPTPTEVIANPTSEGTENLSKLQVGSTVYNITQGGGTNVVANPTGEGTEYLTKLQVGNIVYNIPQGGGGSGGTQLYKHDISLGGKTNILFTIINNDKTNYAGKFISLPFGINFGIDTDNNKIIVVTNGEKLPSSSSEANCYYSDGTKVRFGFLPGDWDSDTVTPL